MLFFVGQTIEANECFFKIVDVLQILPEEELTKLAEYYFVELKPVWVKKLSVFGKRPSFNW